MKFGKFMQLQSSEHPEWSNSLVDYANLKGILKSLKEVMKDEGEAGPSKPFASLTVPQSPDGFGTSPIAYFEGKPVRESDFFKLVDSQVEKVGNYTTDTVKSLRDRTESLQLKVANQDAMPEGTAKNKQKEVLEAEAKSLGDGFLSLEKYVNLCYMGFYKILKKHDKMLPTTPCRQFYMSRLHQQRYIFGDFSDIFVQLSKIYSNLRGDVVAKAVEAEQQNFVRSTKKYWVRTEDVTAVKHFILQHLPVFQLNQEQLTGDSQLTNSVYLDNSTLELYHNRLDKRPGAIAARLRWYGTGEIKTVFVERKTHRESWKGEVSVKERFTLKENQVVPFLRGEYTVDDKVAEMQKAGKSEGDIEACKTLMSEVFQQIDTKQLTPMIRTQYMRVPFQIPFDQSVRISLDTNLTMVKENPDNQPACLTVGRWCRDPNVPVPRTEITHFPHAVLEVKLALPEGEETPTWVTDLLESGMCTHVHKFSKFMHGAAVLLPDLVQAVPYWFDDQSIRASILNAAPLDGTRSAMRLALPANDEEKVEHKRPVRPLPTSTQAGPSGTGPSAAAAAKVNAAAASAQVGPTRPTRPTTQPASQQVLSPNLVHPLLGDAPRTDLMGESDNDRSMGCWDWVKLMFGAGDTSLAAKVQQKVEPKVFFANERTFLSWLSMSATIGTIASAMVAFSAKRKDDLGVGVELIAVLSLVLLFVAMLFIVYAVWVFTWRMSQIRLREDRFDDRKGPLVLSVVVVCALWAIFVTSVLRLVQP
eukprot:jgi/Chlat1/7915/Chrsp68S07353